MVKQSNNKQGNKDVFIYGHHPVELAIKNTKRKILELYYVRGSFPENQIPKTIPTRSVTKDFLDNLLGRDAVHQGIVARCTPLQQITTDNLLSLLSQKENALIMILDQVTDPHNIGAILRSAVAFYADAVIVPETGAPDENGTLAKSASGALELIPFIRVPNLSRFIEKLKKNDFWCIGLDGYAKQSINEAKLPKKCAFIMGSEGSGMRRLTQENCDYCVKLPMNPAIESLNVSNAAALTLYEFRRQYPVR
jgi:23S rRNA (guanosine2251-2'-O)-methyltransferase